MLVQYLVGLCCLYAKPEAVDIVLGDMVLDSAAEKERDVDVTVTIAGGGGLTHAFMAYEVKRERNPLDVSVIEQLCLKLSDMSSITHRAVVSASGYSDAARKKAAHHGIDLYEFKRWTKPLQEQFPALTMEGLPEECFQFGKSLLCWIDFTFSLMATTAKNTFSINGGDKLLNSNGTQHTKYLTFGQYQHELLLRSTEILFPLDPANSVRNTFPIPFSRQEGEWSKGPSWPHTHSLDVARDAFYMKVGSDICLLDMVTINGHLQWQRSNDKPLYYVLENISTGDAFSAALISEEIREGHMTALVFSPNTQNIGIHFVRLADKHLNSIRNIKLDKPN